MNLEIFLPFDSKVDVRVFRGANCDSGHFFVVSKFRYRISMVKSSIARKNRFSIEKLNESHKTGIQA